MAFLGGKVATCLQTYGRPLTGSCTNISWLGATRMMSGKSKKKFYAVRTGREPGVYSTWVECKSQVDHFKGARYKSFPSSEEAWDFVGGGTGGGPSPAPASLPAPLPTEAATPAPRKTRKRANPSEGKSPSPRAAKAAKEVSSPLYKLFFDGGARGNPGPGGAGACLSGPRNKRIWEGSFYQGHCTNNQAEYQGLVEGMKAAKAAGVKRLNVYGDSKLAIQQLQGNWKVKNAGLKPKFDEARSLAKNFDVVEYQHVYRDANGKADALANKAMDNRKDYEKWFVEKDDVAR
ncbi:hypothetical protein BSKO_03953 [Bryopsis sp. KO-2023]|nr:hypothetical protein BSKO_03953 [Bryopsis sp. KO-2023]